MCRDGVLAKVKEIRAAAVRGSHGWGQFADGQPAYDGFGIRQRSRGRASTRVVRLACPDCGRDVAVVSRELDREHYNLPDAGIFEAISSGQPCIALAVVTGRSASRSSLPPNRDTLGRWQGLLWLHYGVAFVAVGSGAKPDFFPANDWSAGPPPPDLSQIVGLVGRVVEDARAHGALSQVLGPTARSNRSRQVEKLLDDVLRGPLDDLGYYFAGRDASAPMVRGPWWGHRPDLVYRRRDRLSVAFEVKVDEDWDHPLGEPLCDLLDHNAVVAIRLPIEGKPDRVRQVRPYITEAERLLEERARFLYVWPRGEGTCAA